MIILRNYKINYFNLYIDFVNTASISKSQLFKIISTKIKHNLVA
jgi:hypothetical protein